MSAGRVVFSGPVGKLAAESGDLDYRLVTSDPTVARRLAADSHGLRTTVAPGPAYVEDDALVVRGPVAALDVLVARLVGEGVAVRALGPVVPPLEAAFLALTGAADEAEPAGQDRAR
jgi:ABC-2 type transport system ATP-binding protein